MTPTNPNRVPAGVTTGGQFTASARGEPDVALNGNLYPDHTTDNGDWCTHSGTPVTNSTGCPQGCRAAGSIDEANLEDIDHDYDDDSCSECGASLDDGEGADGRCGDCADRHDTLYRCENCDEEVRDPSQLVDRLCTDCR